MRYIGYLRKSTEDPERQALSKPAQKRKIQEYYPELKIVTWIEESKSAFHPGREGFNEVMRMLEADEADGIVSYDPTRLSRNEKDAGTITYGLRMNVIKDLKFCGHTFENTPEGIWMLQMALSNSQYYSAKLSKDVKRGNSQHILGGWLNGRTPEGYLNMRRNKEAYVIKDDGEPYRRFQLRRQMWDLMLTGDYSVPMILHIANNEWGYTTRGFKSKGVTYPPGPMSINGLRGMFKNIRYAGRIPIPGKPGEYQKASYPPMITLEEFNRVQMLLGRKGNLQNLPTAREFAFRGPISCGECGCSVTAEEKTQIICTSCKTKFHVGKKTEACKGCGLLIAKMKNPKILNYRFYHCTKKRPCDQRKFTREESLEKQFKALLGKYQILPEFKDWALEVLDSQNEVEAVNTDDILHSQNQAIEEGRRQIKGLISLAAKGHINEKEFIAEKTEVEAKIAQLEDELLKIKERADNWYDTATRFFDLAVHGRERFMKGDIKVKKEVLADIGSNLTLLEGELQFSAHPWLAPIENGYQELEAEYERVRTQNFASIEEKKAAFAGIYNSWSG